MTIFCYKHGIITRPFHVAGVDNVFADRLSRDVLLQESDYETAPHSPKDTSPFLRMSTARRILMTLSDWPSNIPLQKLLELVEQLG
jgi:hypothetical protein